MGSVWVLAFPFRYGPPKTNVSFTRTCCPCGLVVFCVVVVCSASLFCVLPPTTHLNGERVFGVFLVLAD